MKDILAIRDIETGKPIQVRELAEPELQDNGGALYEAMLERYPEPRYEVFMAVAPTMEMFLTNYPRFRTKTTGTQAKQQPGGSNDDSTT